MDKGSLPNTDLGVTLGQRPDETFDDYLYRIATDTIYAARDRNLMMDGAARAVVDVIKQELGA